MVLWMQLATAIRPRHKASLVVDDAKAKFSITTKAQHNQFAKSLAKIFSAAPKPYKKMLKSFVLIGLFDEFKKANAERIVAILREWLPSSVKASTIRKECGVCNM